jgi:uncharacterized protein YvpB
VLAEALARVSDVELDEKPSVRLIRAWEVGPTDVLAEALARVPDVELEEESDEEFDEGFDGEPDANLNGEPDAKLNEEPEENPETFFEERFEDDFEESLESDLQDSLGPEENFDASSNESWDDTTDEDDALSFNDTFTVNETSVEIPSEIPNVRSDESIDASSNENTSKNLDAHIDASPNENLDENLSANSTASSEKTPIVYLPSLQACMRITKSIGEHLRHLVSLFKVFGTASVVLVLVLSVISWLKVDDSQAIVQGDPETTSVITVVESVVPQASALLRDASDATRESAEALADAANASRAGWYEENGDRYYYYTDGTMATGAVEIDGVIVTFDDEGHWVSSRLDVPYISQLPDMPSGCEVAAVAMMLNHAGVDVSKEDVVAQLPYSNDPAEGFTGNVYDEGTYGYGGIIWPSGLLGLVRDYQGSAVDLTGASWESVRGFIDQGRTVCIWFTNDGLDHTVLLVGYSATTVWVNDPLVDKDVTLDIDDFLRYWEQNGYRALSW